MTLTAAVVAFVNAILGLINNFGFNLSDAQRVSIIVAVNAALVLGALVWDTVTKRPRMGAPAGSAVGGPK